MIICMMTDGFGRTWSSDHLTYILHQWRQCGTMEASYIDNDTAESPKVTDVNPSLKLEVSRIPTSLAINNRFPKRSARRSDGPAARGH